MIRFGPFLYGIESSMPWLLILAPLLAAAIPASKRTRVRRAVGAFGCIFLLGVLDNIGMLFLNAEIVKARADTIGQSGLRRRARPTLTG